MLNLRAARGFTLIEIMVAVTIVAILTALVLPTFGGMIQNAKISSSSKSYLIGLQTARAEAIRRNVPVEFVLTNSPVSGTLTPDANGQNWVVRVASAPAGSVIESKSAQEGGGQSGSSPVEVAGVAIAPPSATFAGIVAFNGFGATTGGESITLDISNPKGGPCASAGGVMRCQQIQVRPGGQVMVCDPHASAADSRACPS